MQHFKKGRVMKYQTKKLLFSIATVIVAPVAFAQAVRPWMSSEVGGAWMAGYKGQGTTITFVDDFTSTKLIVGNQRGFLQVGWHGNWTAQEASMIAPLAAIRVQDFSNANAVELASKGLNTINLSYAVFLNSRYAVN
jgi:hypothetical protein